MSLPKSTSKNDSNKNSLDFNLLGEYYHPITTTTDYQKIYTKETTTSPAVKTHSKNLSRYTEINKNDTKTVKTLKQKGKFPTLKDSMTKRNTNLSCQISRNENYLGDNTTSATLEEKEFKNATDLETENKLSEIKELILCYLCRQKPISPKLCPNCQKIACNNCLKDWFKNKANKKCFYCNKIMTYEKMINIPIIDNISNLLDNLILKVNNSISYKSKKNNKTIPTNRKKTNDLSLPKTTCKHSYQVTENNNTLIDKIQINNSGKFEIKDNKDLNYCEKHPEQPLTYYCVNCDKAYCDTCFVFFGNEKNNHIDHKIIEFEKYKKFKFSEIFKESENLDEKSEEINAYINRCKAMINCYEFEKKVVGKYLKLLIDNFNEQINENIKILNDLINNYNNYLIQIKKVQNDIQKYYAYKINDIENDNNKLLTEITKINNIKYYTSKEIDSYSNLSTKIFFNVYQTDLKKYMIKNEGFHFKANLVGSSYQLGLIQKQNEIQIYIYYPIDMNIHKNKFILPFVFLRRKNNNWESFELKESMTYKGNNYFIKRFKSHNFSPINSYVKIKGIIYESWFG